MKRSQRLNLGDDLLGRNTYAHEEQCFIVFAYGTALFCRGAQVSREFLRLDVGKAQPRGAGFLA